MKEFFKVIGIETVVALKERFSPVGSETVPLGEALGRITAADVESRENVPAFSRATMDGYAVVASSTFGATFTNPAELAVAGSVPMGQAAGFEIALGQAARIATGGMLPGNADAVVPVEHTEILDAIAIEIYKSVAPLTHVTSAGDDIALGETALLAGTVLRAQEMALLASFGASEVEVHKKPVVGILSTGDEVAAVDAELALGKIRDMNSYALAAQLTGAGASPLLLGIVPDDADLLAARLKEAMETCDMVLVSGGSSVGSRDHTVTAIEAQEGAEILVHGVAISPGKPTILASVKGFPLWGLPGNVVSAMVAFEVLVRPMVRRLAGAAESREALRRISAVLKENVPSQKGRTDFVRVRLMDREGTRWAIPIFGKSGEIRTMVAAHGLVEVPINEEGLPAGTQVQVRPLF